jgi:hypothetical protein
VARSLYPSVQVPASNPGDLVAVYTNEGLTVLADVSLGPGGPSLSGSEVTVTADSTTPYLYGPDGWGSKLYVSSGGDAVELSAVSAGTPAGSLPSPTTGDGGKVVTVNDAETGYELAAPAGGTSVAPSYCGAEAGGEALPDGVNTIITSWEVDTASDDITIDPDGTINFGGDFAPGAAMYRVRLLAIVTGASVTSVGASTTGGMYNGETNPSVLSPDPGNCIVEWLFLSGGATKIQMKATGDDGALSFAGLDIIRFA